MSVNEKVLKALKEQTANQVAACTRCGQSVTFNNHITTQPADCNRCHVNGHLNDRGCRNRNCPRERTVDAGWSDHGWPR